MRKRLQSGGTWLPTVPRSVWNTQKQKVLGDAKAAGDVSEDRLLTMRRCTDQDRAWIHKCLLGANVDLRPTKEEEEEHSRRYIMGEKCLLCNKQAVWGHLQSDDHMKRLALSVGLDRFLGKPSLFRPLYQGCPGKFTDKLSMSRYWGDDLKSFALKGFGRLRHTGFRAKLRDNKPAVHVPGSDVREVGIAVVPYRSGGGVYLTQGSTVLPWERIPEAPGDFQRDHASQNAREDQQWWPVLTITLTPMSEPGQMLLAAGISVGNVWVVCIYQVLNSTPDAWPARPADWIEVNSEEEEIPPPSVPVLRLRGTAAPPPPPIPDDKSGPAAAEMEEVD